MPDRLAPDSRTNDTTSGVSPKPTQPDRKGGIVAETAVLPAHETVGLPKLGERSNRPFRPTRDQLIFRLDDVADTVSADHQAIQLTGRKAVQHLEALVGVGVSGILQ